MTFAFLIKWFANLPPLPKKKMLHHSVHWGINPSPQTPPPFLAKPPYESANCPSPSFLENPSLYIGFLSTSPPKSQIFQWTRIMLKFFILTPSFLLKVTKFLVKISQFPFLVMPEKNIFVYKLFLPLNISDFRVFFVKTATPHPEKSYPLFSCNPLSKLRPCRRKVGWRFNSPSRKGMHTM